jgi:hypothetical protein
VNALLESLSFPDLERLSAAGDRVARFEAEWAASGDSPVSLLTGMMRVSPFRHYPEGDVYDFASHSQFYYHVHRGNEHGHIHLFLRPKGMPADIRPMVAVDGDTDAPCHLVAVGFDAGGLVSELFTTNRWVTGEAWYAAPAVAAMVPRFSVTSGRYRLVGQWLTSLVALFQPLIVELVHRRDAEIERWSRAHPGRPALDDGELEVTSRERVSIPLWRASLRDALNR